MYSAVLRACHEAQRHVPPLIAFLTVSAIGLAQGGYFPVQTSVSTLGMLALVVAGVITKRRFAAGSLDNAMQLALAALAGWTALSVLWSVDPAQSVLEAQRALLYVAAATAAVLASQKGSTATLLGALAAACTLLSVYALASAGRGPLAAPVGYSDALGLVAAMGLILALGLASSERRRVAAAAILPLGAVVYLAQSRAAVAGLAFGVVIAIGLGRGVRTAVVAALLAAVVLALMASAGADSLRARTPLWSVAWHSAHEHLLLGTGAGSFERVWWRERPAPGGVRDAHNLYLETLAELGPLGLVFLSTALFVPLVAAVHARRHPLVPSAAGAYVAYLVHAAVHWDWEIPVVTLIALGCASSLVVAARRDVQRTRLAGHGHLIALAAVVLLAVGTYACLLGNIALQRSSEALRFGATAEARAFALRATRWVPWSGEPWRILGETSLSRGNRAAARASFRHGLERDPHSWPLWADLAQAANGAEARAAAREASALNPLGRTR